MQGMLLKEFKLNNIKCYLRDEKEFSLKKNRYI